MGFSRSRREEKDSVEQALGLDRKFSSVAHGDCYRAIHKDDNQTVVVWVTRQPLDQVQRKDFLKHVRAFESVVSTRVKDYGIDSSQRGFVAVCVDSTTALDTDKPSAKQIRRRFIECLALVDILHRSKIACGNLSEGSFVLTSSGDVQFIGMLGGFNLGKDDNRPLETLPYELPRSEGEAMRPMASDVYALAILGLRLYGAQFPPSGISPEMMSDYLERLMQDAPRWVKKVLVDIVRNPRQKAFRNAGDLLAGLIASERSHAFIEPNQNKGGGRSRGAMEIDDVSVAEIASRARGRGQAARGATWRRFVRSPAAKILLVGMIVLNLIEMKIIPLTKLQRVVFGTDSPTVTSVQPSNPSTGAGQHKSIDQESFDKLLELIENSNDAAEYQNSWNALFRRARKVGMHTSARFIADAANRTVGEGSDKPTLLVQMLNPENSPQNRLELIQAFAKRAPDLAAKVAAGFVLDFPDTAESLREVIVQGVDKFLPQQFTKQAAEHSTNTLILVLDLDNQLGPDVTNKLVQTLSDNDLWWLMKALTSKRSAKLSVIAKSILSRGLLSWPSSSFISIISESETDSTSPADSLINSALSGPSVPDVTRYSTWVSPLSTQALYTVLVTSKDKEVLAAALDGVGIKPNSVTVASDVVKALIEQNAIPTDYALLVGALGLSDQIPEPKLKEALESIRGTPAMPALIKALTQNENPTIVVMVLDVYGSTIHPQTLMPLLSNPEPQVRMKVLPFLKELRLASARAEMKRMYEQETDPKVREIYEQEILD